MDTLPAVRPLLDDLLRHIDEGSQGELSDSHSSPTMWSESATPGGSSSLRHFATSHPLLLFNQEEKIASAAAYRSGRLITVGRAPEDKRIF
jgi:hypothetical protein